MKTQIKITKAFKKNESKDNNYIGYDENEKAHDLRRFGDGLSKIITIIVNGANQYSFQPVNFTGTFE